MTKTQTERLRALIGVSRRGEVGTLGAIEGTSTALVGIEVMDDLIAVAEAGFAFEKAMEGVELTGPIHRWRPAVDTFAVLTKALDKLNPDLDR